MDTKNMSFEEKFKIFCSFSVNQSLMKFIARKRDEKMLDYQLSKINFRRKNKNAERLFERFSRLLKTKTPAMKPIVKKEAKAQKEPSKTQKTVENHPKNLKSGKRLKVDPEKLPPDIKVLWEKNSHDYKIQRATHEKMKLATTNEKRAEHLEKIVELGKIIKQRWETIDAFLHEKPSLSASTYTFNVNSYRSVITRALHKKEFDEGQRQKVAHVVSEFQKWNIKIKEETLQKLREKGFID